MERWEVIDAEERYEVSDAGRVRSRRTGRIISPYERRRADGSPVMYVNLHLGSRRCTSAAVKQLVAWAFVPIPGMGYSARAYNINGDHTDNRAENLAYRKKAKRKTIAQK